MDILINDLRANNDPSLSQTNGRITTWEKLQQYCPVEVKDSSGEVSNGTAYWKITEIYIRTGVAEYIPKVFNQSNQPLANYVVFRHWPGAPKLPPEVSYRPYDNAVGGLTNGNGDAGFPYGGGSVYVSGKGPDAIWVSPTVGKPNEPQASDVISNLGWLGGSDHLTPNPVFKWTVKEGNTIPPVDGDFRLNVVTNGEYVGYIPIVRNSEGDEESFMELVDGDGNSYGVIKIV